jgi:PAS domain S-box-containing protein
VLPPSQDWRGWHFPNETLRSLYDEPRRGVTHVEHTLTGARADGASQILREDDEYIFYRGSQPQGNGTQRSVLLVQPAADHPSRANFERLAHEYELRHELDGAWALRPLELVRDAGRTILVFEDAPGLPLDRTLGAPLDIRRFLTLAVGITAALGKVHERGLVHKDIKPANILADDRTGEVRLTGFGIASRLPRQRQPPQPPETIAGTFAYMAPEQTGRMNRSIDSRSDLYALGVTFYEMLTGVLPFTAADSMEWVHCHLARRPVPPVERLTEIPGVISEIVMKLLAKRAEDRYQTAAGLERDLRRCQAEWGARRGIDAFPLGEHDATDRLLIPEKLYGRQSEVETLLEAFDRVVAGGTAELVLVSGYSGIGKSSVVNELQPMLVPSRGLFASGKFDQYKRDIPYSTLAQAFQSLIRPLLAKSETELGTWRRELRDALDESGQLIVDLIPELKLVIGDQPPVAEASPKDAQRRFQLVFRRFIAVFARREHPLALFLDDLQWLDAATLDLLEDLLTHSDLQHLLLVGAYRNNEVDPAHPLMRKLEAIKSAGGKVSEITLGPLAQEHLEQLLADALRCEPEWCAPLTQLLQEKTAGNPFFAIQFISALAEEGLLAFNHDAECWRWELARIRAKGYTDNVVDLMMRKVIRLSDQTQGALRQLACLGNVAEANTLSLILETSVEQVHAALWESVRQGLVERVDSSYKLIHDRVQEAAYSLIPESSRAEAHLRIGRLLVEHTPAEKQDETIFDVVNQLNRGAALVTSREERERLAEFNLMAGKRAKASAAFASALKYFNAGATFLSEDCWERRHDLIFALELQRAECEFLIGEMETADERLTVLSSRTANTVERAAVACLQIDACLELFQSDRAVTLALDYLRKVGIEWSPQPTQDEVRREYEQIWSHLGGRAIEDVEDLPLMSDPESLATVEVVAKLGVPAAASNDENLNCLSICKAVNFCLERGNCDAACYAYVVLSRVAIPLFRDYETAFRFGQVGLELIEERGLKRFEARSYIFFADLIALWTKHVRSAIELLRRASDAATKIGDFTFVHYAHFRLSSDLLLAGEPLSQVQREFEVGLPSYSKARLTGDTLWAPHLALIRTLRGLTPRFGCFDGKEIEEASFERQLAGNPYLRGQAGWYWVRKMVARYFAGDYAAALEASSQALPALSASRAMIEEAEYHFYSALSRAASCDSTTPEEREQHLAALAPHQRQLESWAANCPENFENRAALVGAEIARIEGHDLEAMRLYEEAIRSSRANGFVNNEALAYERASSFYRTRGFSEFADTYLRNARACYAAWGADGKVRQLDRLYPGLKEEQRTPGPTSTITAPVEGLDLATMIRVSQAVSSEIVLEKLFRTVMREAMEHAGAERGLLIVPRGEDLRTEAESVTSGNDVIVTLRDSLAAPAAVPESILRYVVRTHESVIVDDAFLPNQFTGDPYFAQSRVRSILCLPLLNQAKVSGVLYLENNLTPRAFTSERIAVLKVLASQAAISLENTRLYRDLEDREAKIRRLVDSNILGIFIWNVEGAILEANEAFLRMLQCSREDLVSSRMRWRDMTPLEWRERDDQALAAVKATASVQPYEKEYVRKDGTRVPVLIGAALFSHGGKEGVAFVLDLSERKRAEDALRKAEDELARVSRVTALSALTASIAHEVNQPLSGIITNAGTCLHMLDSNPPNIDGARETARRILRDGNRAAGVTSRLRALYSKRDFTSESLGLNEIAQEVIALLSGELQRSRIILQWELAEALPVVWGDRIQLQQVILNLVRNAVDAMAEVDDRPRQLLIKTEQERHSDNLRLTVRDAGVGLTPQTLDSLFNAFHTTKSGGMGIGLFVSRSIIERHHGRLWAERNNQAPGATFAFSIPWGAEEDT